jgi:hypothetical protein
MSSHEIQNALWISQPFLQALIGMALYRRRLHKEFPAFFAYLAVQIIFFAVSFSIQDNYGLYFDVYYAAAGVNVVLAFKIIHEVFSDVFRPFPALKDLGSALFKWAAMIMVLISVVTGVLSPGWDQPIMQTILVVQRCVDIIQCGMVIFLLAFCQSLGVSWKRQSFGIVLGFGVCAGSELLILALHSARHLGTTNTSLIGMLAEEMSLLVWLSYSVLQARQAARPVLVPQRWDNALSDIQPHREADSLIPMFEHMVEQALSKTQDQHV